MIQPLILLLYERLLPGGQLVNRLQDLGYRVQATAEACSLVEQCARDKPLLVIADLEPGDKGMADAILRLKQHQETAHIPVIAFADAANEPLLEAGRQAGAKLVVTDVAIVAHLNQFLEQALQVD